MSLDLEIQALLRSTQVQEINFTMRGIRLTGAGYTELSACFSDHTIRRRIRVTTRPELVPRGSDATYNPTTDRILLRSDTVLQTAIGRSYVVHECAHAQIDLRRLSTPLRSEEGAAFIAEAWYLLASGVGNTEIDASQKTGEFRLIAADLRNRVQTTGGAVELSADQINRARRAVATVWHYRTGHYTSNGIRGYVYRGD